MAITGELISKNVRRLRLKKKLSQVEVASYAAVPQTQYKKIERGLCVPRVDTLQRIAEALDANFYEIIESQNCLKSVRFRARKKIRTREDVLIRVDRWLRCFNEIEELVKDKLEDRVAPMIERLHKLADEDRKPQAAAIIAREMLGVAEKEPIWDICGLFESGGIKVFPLWLASDNFFGLSVAKSDGGPVIAVNVWDKVTVERRIFSASHELGHLMMHLDAFDVDQTEENDREEDEANEFAGHFLMPQAAFENHLRKSRGLSLVDAVLKIKRYFSVSYKTVLMRLIASGRVDQKSIWREFALGYLRQYGKGLRFKEEPHQVHEDAFYVRTGEQARASEPEGLTAADFMGVRFMALIRRGIEDGVISLGWAAEALDKDLPSVKDWIASWKYFDGK